MMCWCKVNDGSHSRIREGGGTAREEVGTEDPEACTQSQLGGRQYYSHLLVPFCYLLDLVILIRFHPVKNIKGWSVHTVNIYLLPAICRHCAGCSECSVIKNAILVQTTVTVT